MTQSDQVFRFVRAKILDGEFVPGSKLKFNDLVAACDVSLGAVREALSRLSGDGFVVPVAQKGYKIAAISREELIDLTDVRISIEALCMAPSITKGDLEWEAALVAAYHRLRRLSEIADEDNENWCLAHSEFHFRLAAACGSPILLKIRELLYAQAERYRRLSVPLSKTTRNVDEEHKGILDAALARDAEKACALMSLHLSKTSRILLESDLFSGVPREATGPERSK